MTDRKAIVAIASGVGIVAVVSALVLIFGVIPLPEFPSLADEPDPSIPGRVAFINWDDSEQCLYVVAASGGTPTEVICETGERSIAEGELLWTADGMLIVQSFGPIGPEYRLLDPDTGTEVDRFVVTDEMEPPPWDVPESYPLQGANGATVYESSDGDESLLVLRQADGSTRELIRVEGPRDYSLQPATWSPDGAWFLVTDSEERLIVVGVEGDSDPRLLADPASSWPTPAWYIEGVTEVTWEP